MCLIGLAIVICSPTANNAAPAISPDDIFEKARQFWYAQKYPPYLNYVVTVTVTEKNKIRSEHYLSAYNATTGAIWVDPRSDYEITHPATGTGVQFCFLACATGPRPAPQTDFLGVPLLAPTYSFGMSKFVPMERPHAMTPEELVAKIRNEFHDPDPRIKPSPSPSPTGIPQIAAVIVHKKEYIVRLAGIEDVNSHRCFSLKLTPVQDPGRYRLREAWIDTKTYATERILIASNFVEGPGTHVPWVVDFADIEGLHLISSEKALQPLTYGGAHYSEADISFSSLQRSSVPHGTREFSTFLVLREPSD